MHIDEKHCSSRGYVLKSDGIHFKTLTSCNPINFVNSYRTLLCLSINKGGIPYVYDTEDAEETGTWNSWQAAPEGCSRTCGGGVLAETRTCENPDQSKCTGPTIRYSSCNIGPCPRGSRDFR